MGFFKKIKNFITGGAAKVSVIFENNISDGASPVRCFVTATADQQCKISEVYVEFKGEERYRKEEIRDDTDSDGNIHRHTETVTKYENLHYEKQIATSDIMLSEGQSEKWLVSFDFPAEVIPTYQGKNAHFKWMIRAGLDMSGIDPKSDWTEIMVEKEISF